MSEKSFSFTQGIQTIVNNTAERAREILEEKASGLLHTRAFVVAANVVLVQQVATEFFGRILEPEELAKLDSDTMLEIQTRVRPVLLALFDERVLENALGYRRR